MHTFPMQPRRSLTVHRLADCWIVWLSGSHLTVNQTYAILYDSGHIEYVKQTSDHYDVVRIAQQEQQKEQNDE
jgi:hypothetical protein